MLQTYKTHLTKKIKLTADVYYLSFDLDDPKEFTFIPGQYMIMLVPRAQGESVRRLYSIVTTPSQKTGFSLLIKEIPGGAASTYIQTLNSGDIVQFQGPAGIFSLKQTPRDKIFLVTGCGLAPIRSMILSTIEDRASKIGVEDRGLFHYFLYWGVPKVEDVYFLDELKKLSSEHPNFHFHICLSREENLDKIPEEDRKYFMLGRVTKELENMIIEGRVSKVGIENNPSSTIDPQPPSSILHPLLSNFDFYLCGNRDVTDSLKEYLGEKQIPKEQVYFEKF